MSHIHAKIFQLIKIDIKKDGSRVGGYGIFDMWCPALEEQDTWLTLPLSSTLTLFCPPSLLQLVLKLLL